MAEATLALADVAGVAHVDATHERLLKWREVVSDPEWVAMRVVIIGLREPHQDYAATQYFNAVLPTKSNSPGAGESARVVYLESLDIDRADRPFAKERRAVATLLCDPEGFGAHLQQPVSDEH